MKIIILGGNGMLGHRLVRELAKRHDVYATFRGEHVVNGLYDMRGLYDITSPFCVVENVNIENHSRIAEIVEHIKPEAIINAVAIVKQRNAEVTDFFYANSVFPKFLSDLCAKRNIRLLQYSTDCVFSGNRGNYSENDLPDPVDIYGKTKLLGEVVNENQVVLRTSIVGWQINYFYGLLSWLASMRGGEIAGYRRAIFSGFSVGEMSRISEYLLTSKMQGLYHVASSPISKCELLTRLTGLLNWNISIIPDDDFLCDRSLSGEKFNKESGWIIPSWDTMIENLAREYKDYKKYYE